MESISPAEAAKNLQLLTEAAADRDNKLKTYPGAAVLSSSDEENGSDSPIFDSFYES